MKILGISCFYHDSAAALVIDGQIMSAAQEERFTRKKHDDSFPENAVLFCLKENKLAMDDIDAVVYYEKPLLKFERILETYLYTCPKGYRSFLNAMSVWITKKLWISSILRKKLKYKGELFYSDHHLSHAASAFFPSPFHEAAIITADGVGEWSTTSISHGTDNQIKILKELHFPHSLGMLYSAFTYYTGFRVNSGEYKVMGLAPYGRGLYTQKILDHLIDIKTDGSFRLNMEYFNYLSGLTMTSEKFHDLFDGAPRKPESKITQKEMDLAQSVQEVTELIMQKLAHHAMVLTETKNICLAGGVALNCVSNGKLLKSCSMNNLFIQPAAGDSGGALGAALALHYQHFAQKRSSDEIQDHQKGSFLGPHFSNSEIESFLKKSHIPYQLINDEPKLIDLLTQKIIDGRVIGLFQGKMEFGPRALGARSIIGDARNPEMQKKMNLKIKYRESFRPFAPIVIDHQTFELFDLPIQNSYMLLVGQILEKHQKKMSENEKNLFGIDKLNIARSHIPAITHVDYSARVQTITKKENPFCYNLLQSFYDKTGVGVLVNTSFNVRGEPIVCTPRDALQCFLRTEMDDLLLENFLIEKEKIPDSLLQKDESWKKEFSLD